MNWLPHLYHATRTVLPYIVVLEEGRYFFFAGLTTAILWLFWNARFAARKIQPRAAGPRDIRREVLASVRTGLVFAATGLSLYLCAKIGFLTIYPDFKVAGPLYFASSLVLMIVLHDAYFYWTHRLLHHPRLFRAMHRTHHKSRTPTPWTAYPFDWPEAVVNAAFVPLFVAIVPMHDFALYVFMTHQTLRNVLGHAGVEMYPNGLATSPLFSWINATTHHDLHHQEGRYNYGLYFGWWDRLMGTEHPLYRRRFREVTGAVRNQPAAEPAPQASAEKLRRRYSAVAAFVLAAIVAASALRSAQAAEPRGIFGLWATKDSGSFVKMTPCQEAAPEGQVCGHIVWLRRALDNQGRPRRDIENSDAARRGQPLLGLQILRGLRESSPGTWTDGALYNPDDGRTYSGSVRLTADNTLELSGCALMIFCRSQVWTRATDDTAKTDQ